MKTYTVHRSRSGLYHVGWCRCARFPIITTTAAKLDRLLTRHFEERHPRRYRQGGIR
jgi:hypothetical protein